PGLCGPSSLLALGRHRRLLPGLTRGTPTAWSPSSPTGPGSRVAASRVSAAWSGRAQRRSGYAIWVATPAAHTAPLVLLAETAMSSAFRPALPLLGLCLTGPSPARRP